MTYYSFNVDLIYKTILINVRDYLLNTNLRNLQNFKIVQ